VSCVVLFFFSLLKVFCFRFCFLLLVCDLRFLSSIFFGKEDVLC
jgi:hypothetical protein